MAKTDWKDELASFMDDLRVVDECKVEAPEKFNQFCEFIAESSFEGALSLPALSTARTWKQ